MYWSIRCVVWWVVVWYQVVNYLSKSKLKTIIKIGSTDQSKTWNLKVKKLMYSSNKNLVECWCSITKVNGNKNLKFLIVFLFVLFFFLFRHQFIHLQIWRRFGSRVRMDEIHYHYASNRKRLRSTIFSFYFTPNIVKSLLLLRHWVAWTWNRCFVVTKHLC